MKRFKGQLRKFPEEIVQKMLERQLEQSGLTKVSVFEENKLTVKSGGGFTWASTKEGDLFWREIIQDLNFDVFYQKYPNIKESLSNNTKMTQQNHNSTFYRMNRQGVFSPSKATLNQCGLKGINHYEYQLVMIISDKLDENGFTVDHNDINESINKSKIFGSCEEMQLIIYKAVSKVIPKDHLLAYKCAIKPIDIGSKAFIEYIQCGNPAYLSLL